jgi:hypothetical protein
MQLTVSGSGSAVPQSNLARLRDSQPLPPPGIAAAATENISIAVNLPVMRNVETGWVEQ